MEKALYITSYREIQKQSFAEDFVSIWIALICPMSASPFTSRLQCTLFIPISAAFGFFWVLRHCSWDH